MRSRSAAGSRRLPQRARDDVDVGVGGPRRGRSRARRRPCSGPAARSRRAARAGLRRSSRTLRRALSRYAEAGCERVYLWPLGDEARQLELGRGDGGRSSRKDASVGERLLTHARRRSPARPRRGTRSSATSTCAPTRRRARRPGRSAGARRRAAVRLPERRRPARRAVRLRPPLDPARPRRLPRVGHGPLAGAARRGAPPRRRRALAEVRPGRLPRAPVRRRSFDAALNLFTSLGYLGDEEDTKALAEIGRVLRPAAGS